MYNIFNMRVISGTCVGVIHGDFNFRNLVFDDKKRVKAVLDWEMACCGDPMSDLSEFVLCRAKPKALDGKDIG